MILGFFIAPPYQLNTNTFNSQVINSGIPPLLEIGITELRKQLGNALFSIRNVSYTRLYKAIYKLTSVI